LDTLRQLKAGLDEALAPLGWEPDKRRFHPHLTLGRVKRQHRDVLLPWDTPVVPTSWSVSALHLIESQLRPDGPLYTIRHSGRLGRAAG
jgi:2'-5' RNA ligase